MAGDRTRLRTDGRLKSDIDFAAKILLATHYDFVIIAQSFGRLGPRVWLPRFKQVDEAAAPGGAGCGCPFLRLATMWRARAEIAVHYSPSRPDKFDLKGADKKMPAAFRCQSVSSFSTG